KSKLGGLSSLAAMAGVNLNVSGGSELSPMVYPEIVQSIPFKKALMQTKLNFQGIDHPVTYYDYYTKYAKTSLLGNVMKYTIGLPGTIKKAIFAKKKATTKPLADTSRLTWLTNAQESLAKNLDNTVYVNVDNKTGNVSLTAIMPEPLAAAQLGQRAQQLLQQFIINYKIKKTKAQLNFIQGRYLYRKKAFEEAQGRLARFIDQNRNVSTAVAQAQQERLQNEYQLAFGVYSSLAQQLEQAKIQVKQETPVFSIIQPVTVPNQRFKPKRTQILIIWTFIGLIIGIGWVFGKEYFDKVKVEWEEKE
ncbi:hypothetical protein MNBD_BACTEROID07-1813, partial [hydrothermal vent metagenome]